MLRLFPGLSSKTLVPATAISVRAFSSSRSVLKKKGAAEPANAGAASAGGFDSKAMKGLFEDMLKSFEQKVKEARSNTLSSEKFQNLTVDLGGGASAQLKSMATIAARGNKINIVAFDPKEVKRIQTAIISELGMPTELSTADKQTLSVNVPQQTEAKKAAAARLIKEAYESLRNNSSNKLSVASIRAKYLNPLKKAATKNSGVSKDDVKKQTQEIEQIVKIYSTKLQELYKKSSN